MSDVFRILDFVHDLSFIQNKLTLIISLTEVLSQYIKVEIDFVMNKVIFLLVFRVITLVFYMISRILGFIVAAASPRHHFAFLLFFIEG